MPGPGHNRGWNPSGWSHRGPSLVLAVLGLAIAAYLALYQYGVVSRPWDPLFGSASSSRVLNSKISEMLREAFHLPVTDAALGVLGYLAEVILIAIGGRHRSREFPWLVILYGFTVAGMAAVGVGLVLSQAFLVRAWCTLCLCSAGITIVVALLSIEEVVAAWRTLDKEEARIEAGQPAG